MTKHALDQYFIAVFFFKKFIKALFSVRSHHKLLKMYVKAHVLQHAVCASPREAETTVWSRVNVNH